MISQLSLFSEPAARRHLTIREKMDERMMSPVVERGLLDACKARPGEWLNVHELYEVAITLDARSVFGHVLSRLTRKGLIEEDRIYFGSIENGDYQGVTSRWRFVPKGSA